MNQTAAHRQANISPEDQRRVRNLHSVLKQLPGYFFEGKDAQGMKIPLFPHLFTVGVAKAFPMFRVVHDVFHKRGERKFRSWLLTPEGNIVDLFSGESGVTSRFEAPRIYSRENPFYQYVPASRVLMIEGRLIRQDDRKLEIVEDIKTILLELRKRR